MGVLYPKGPGDRPASPDTAVQRIRFCSSPCPAFAKHSQRPLQHDFQHTRLAAYAWACGMTLLPQLI